MIVINVVFVKAPPSYDPNSLAAKSQRLAILRRQIELFGSSTPPHIPIECEALAQEVAAMEAASQAAPPVV